MHVPRPSRPGAPAVALVVTLVATALLSAHVYSTGRARDARRFRHLVEDTTRRIQTRLDTYIELLRAGAALVTVSHDVDRDEFHEFIGDLHIAERYPGIQGIGYSRRLKAEERAAFEAHARATVPGFRVWPDNARPEYYPIVFAEPHDRLNTAALGYDMFSEPVRRAAMERARDTDAPAASGRVTLAQEIDEAQQAGFLVYVPVYRAGAPAGTTPERAAALDGFVYATFRADDLLRSTMGEAAGVAIVFRVYDGAVEGAFPLYDSGGSEARDSARFAARRTIAVAGRPWTVAFVSRPVFDEQAPFTAPVLTAAAGIVLAALLFTGFPTPQAGPAPATRHFEELARSEEALRARETALSDLVARERRARDRAEAAGRAKDEFLATLSHELRTPLNAIMGWSSMLKTGRVREDRRAEAIEVIARNADAQARLIDDLLDVSRIITGHMRLDLAPIAIAPILRQTIDTVRPSADARGVAIISRVDEGVGGALGDAARLQQIVWNLLSNAIKFTDAGGTVTVEAHATDGQVHISVSDTGVGIDPSFLPFVFDRFRQADSSTTRRHGGSGLGLAIARHLVELHGGRIEADSAGVGQGATFRVHLAAAPLPLHA